MHLIENVTSDAIRALREANLKGPAQSNSPLIPGILLSWDPNATDMEMAIASPPGQLLTVVQTIGETPLWHELHIALGHATFSPGDTIGLVLERRGFDETEPSFFVRTFFEDHFSNTDLAEPHLILRRTGIRTVLYTVAPTDSMTAPGRFHTLIARLPTRSGRFEICDLRVFVVNAAEGVAAAPTTIARAVHTRGRT